MKQTSAGALSGCLVWIIAFGVISICILPLSVMVGGFTSFSDFAIRQTGEIICPENTTPDIRTYASTTTDQYGNRQPSTAYVLQCKDASGEVVMEDPIRFGFLWIGIIAALGLILAGVLAFLLAAPAGILITAVLNKLRKKT